MKWKEQLAQRAAVVEAALERMIPLPEGYNRPVYEAMRYSCLGGGKRLRRPSEDQRPERKGEPWNWN